MVYKNIIYRLLISLLLFSIYIITIFNYYLLFLFVTSLYIIIFSETFIYFKKYKSYIILYLSLSYLCFLIFFFQYFDYFLLNILVFSIIFYDSCSYLTGSLLGKNYVFIKISPKKTLEGYIGGIVLTNIIFLIYFNFMSKSIEFLNFVILINFIIFFSIVGDLMQSFFKRKNYIKDSSNFLPGHGGFFDRFDSLISSIIFLLIYIAL